MLRSAKSFIGRRLAAKDGSIGHGEDFLFDDLKWAARYLVADTSGWLHAGRRVLISPYSLNDPDLGKHSEDIPVDLTREEIENSPPIESDAPISRRREAEMASFFRHPVYWEGEMLWGNTPFPLNEEPPSPEELERHVAALEAIEACHLRSANEVFGYAIEATDGSIGKVDDFILEMPTWAIRYIVADTGTWIPGRRVLLSPDWISGIDWYEAKVTMNLTRDAIEHSPVYDPLQPVNREYEDELFDYYGRPVYY